MIGKVLSGELSYLVTGLDFLVAQQKYLATPNYNSLRDSSMRGHNVCLYAEIYKMISKVSLYQNSR